MPIRNVLKENAHQRFVRIGSKVVVVCASYQVQRTNALMHYRFICCMTYNS